MLKKLHAWVQSVQLFVVGDYVVIVPFTSFLLARSATDLCILSLEYKSGVDLVDEWYLSVMQMLW